MLSRFVALSVSLTRNAIVVAALSYAPPFDRAKANFLRYQARSVGLLFVRYPVNAMNFPGSDLDGLGELFDDSSQTVLAYCRTGTRCANLWVATRTEDDMPQAVNVTRAIGFDLSMVVR